MKISLRDDEIKKVKRRRYRTTTFRATTDEVVVVSGDTVPLTERPGIFKIVDPEGKVEWGNV